MRTRYSGPITYAANHGGEEARITWWDAVDYIGVDAYYSLTDENDPTLAELKVAWTPRVTILANLACTWGKPVLFTEIGYRSQDGTNRQRPTPTPTPQPNYGRAVQIYADELGPDWDDWSWNATRDLAATDQVYSGTQAISATLGAWGARSFWHPAFDASPFRWLEFYVRGSPSGQQRLWAFVNAEGDMVLRKRPVNDCRCIKGGVIEAEIWKRVRIPLSDLNATGRSLVRVSIQNRSGQASTAFWVDELQLIGATWRVHLPLVMVNGD